MRVVKGSEKKQNKEPSIKYLLAQVWPLHQMSMSSFSKNVEKKQTPVTVSRSLKLDRSIFF